MKKRKLSSLYGQMGNKLPRFTVIMKSQNSEKDLYHYDTFAGAMLFCQEHQWASRTRTVLSGTWRSETTTKQSDPPLGGVMLPGQRPARHKPGERKQNVRVLQ